MEINVNDPDHQQFRQQIYDLLDMPSDPAMTEPRRVSTEPERDAA